MLIVDPLQEYGSVAVVVSGPEELAEYLERTSGRWRIAYQNDHIEDDFDSLCVAAYELGDLLFVVEEADLFCSPTYISSEFYRLIVYGRHRKSAVLTVSRVPADVHRTITRQAWEIYCFTTQEPNDLDYLRRYVGADFAEGVQQLAPHQHRYMNLWDRSGEVSEEDKEDERSELPAADKTGESPNDAS